MDEDTVLKTADQKWFGGSIPSASALERCQNGYRNSLLSYGRETDFRVRVPVSLQKKIPPDGRTFKYSHELLYN